MFPSVYPDSDCNFCMLDGVGFETDLSTGLATIKGVADVVMYCSTTFSVANNSGLITWFLIKFKPGMKLLKCR